MNKVENVRGDLEGEKEKGLNWSEVEPDTFVLQAPWGLHT